MIRVISCLILLAVVTSSQAKGCAYNGKVYSVGASWVSGRTICECLDNGKVLCQSVRLGLCDLWGDPHFTSFDGKKFDYQGTCRYVLSRDCCNNSWSIEVQLIEYSATTSVTEKFTIRFGSYVVDLSKPNLLDVNGVAVPSMFWDDAQLRCEVIAGYMMVTLKDLGVWFRWNGQYHAQVYVLPDYAGKLCGLCADFNGNPANDLTLTSTGEPVDPAGSINAWGETWMTHQQPKRCDGTIPDPGNDEDCTKYTSQMAQCEQVFQLSYFAACAAVIPYQPFIEDCHTEMCACASINGKGCVCHAVSGYIAACEAAGYSISILWKVKYGCGDCVIGDMVYPHGHSWRIGCMLSTCSNGVITTAIMKDCCYDRGQYYPNGQTWYYKCEKNTCVRGTIVTSIKEDCCTMNKVDYYPAGYVVNGGCKTCECSGQVAGQWDCSVKTCVYNGISYKCGSMWTDGCMKCKCNEDGTVTCKEPLKEIATEDKLTKA